jgi:cellulose synthase (UDP-forming)
MMLGSLWYQRGGLTRLAYRLKAGVQRVGSSLLPSEAKERHRLRLKVFRIIALANLVLGFYYIVWRYTSSINVRALWFAIPLILAETYSFIDAILFMFMMWKPPRRVAPVPLERATVDVYITTYNEPVELVRLTAEAATRIAWPGTQVYILDDATRPAMKAMAEEIGCEYISRGEEWIGKPRHAKAGNVNNALLQTSGEFILILDADQIPAPEIVEHSLGYFRDPKVAFVQTPQYFYNLPPGDPFGSDAPLFYGPIQQGKDGWGAAFFCGSNAILRREALMQLSLAGYVQEMEKRVRRGLSQLERDQAHRQADTPAQQTALLLLREALAQARQALEDGQSLEAVSGIVREAVAAGQRIMAEQDMAAIAEDLRNMAAGDEAAAQVSQFILQQLPALARTITEGAPLSPQGVGVSPTVLEDLDLTRSDEAIPLMTLATYTVTEDMATAMRLHALGWRSVFHPEILAYGLAPEDLDSALRQRLRWAQGTIQVFLRENPFLIKGLSFPQRLQYFTTIYSYFSGFFNLVFLLSPVVYLFTAVLPVSAWSVEFFWRLVPFLLLNKLMFRYVAWGLSVWRGEQYSLALFPLWIRAVVSVITGAKLGFVVTPKRRQSGNYLKLVWPQLLIVWLTALAIVYGLFSLLVGWNLQVGGVLVNVFWGFYNIVMLWAIVRAALYKPPAGWEARPPAFLFPSGYPIEVQLANPTRGAS